MRKHWVILLAFTISVLMASCSLDSQKAMLTIPSPSDVVFPEATPTYCVGRVTGTFEFEDGTILHASEYDFINHPRSQDYDAPPALPTSYVTLEADTHEYWIREDWLRVYGLMTDGENLITNCSTSLNCPMGRPAFSVEFLADGLDYLSSLDDVVRFSPDCPPLFPANEYTYETETESLKVTWVSWEGESHDLPVMAIYLVQYEYAPPNMFCVLTGYGWHQYDTIKAVPSGKDTASQYEFSHLSGVEFSRQYDTSREAVFTMFDGDKFEVTIIRQGARSEVKSEGLLFSLYSSPVGDMFDERYKGILLYVPFSKVNLVHWEAFE